MILTSSIPQSKFTSYSQELHSPWKSLLAKRDCLIQFLPEFLLTKTTGTNWAFECATHLFTTMPDGKLQWAACLIRKVVLGGSIFTTPGTLKEAFAGIHSGVCLLPIITLPIKSS